MAGRLIWLAGLLGLVAAASSARRRRRQHERIEPTLPAEPLQRWEGEGGTVAEPALGSSAADITSRPGPP